LVEQHAGHLLPCGEQNVPLLQAGGRVLAEPISADRDVPPFRRATRDGYAVRAADLAALPGRLKIVGEIKAGVMSGAQSAMNSYETFTIMTGAPVPPGADAVVMVEYTSRHGEFVEINRTIAPGENIVPQGAEAKSGSLLLAAGTRLNAPAIALAASVGRSQLKVFSRPRIAVLATGDEIVELDAETGPAQIRNSNSYSLAVQIEEAGGDAVLLPIAPDNPQRLRELIEEGLRCDLLIMTGGVSMGRYDLVEQELLELQAEFLFTGVKIQPGRPAVFGRIAGDATSVSPANKYFFGLPGNPVSTMVTFELLARPALEALCGMTPRPLLFVHARLKADIRTKTGLTRFLPAILSGAYGNAQVELVPWQGSGDIAAQSRANCYIVIPPDREEFLAGEWVAIMLRS
jgi:molybdopterin molybdotransferase